MMRRARADGTTRNASRAAAVAAALAAVLGPGAAAALEKTANPGFEAAVEPGTSWTEVQTTLTGAQDAFARTTAQKASGTYAFYAAFHGTANNRQVDKSLTQTFTPATAVRARMRASYMRTSTGAVDSHTISVKLRDGATDVLVPVNVTANGPGTDAAFVTSAWTSDVLLTAGRTYTIETRWVAQMDANEAQGAYVDDVELMVSPAAPTAAPIAGTTTVQLGWAASTSPSGPALRATDPYRVYRGASSGGEAALAFAQTTGFTDPGTTGNTTYWYQVTDLDTTGAESPRSAEVSVLTIPGAPVGLAAGSPGAGGVPLTWQAPAGQTGVYVLERAPDAGGAPGPWGLVTDTIPNGTLSYSDTTATGPAIYWYRVRGQNASGTSAPSNQVQVTLSATVPGQPGTPTATPSGTVREIVVGWDPATGATAGYKVWRSTDGTNFGASPVATGVSSPWTDTAANGLQGNTRYSYRVQASNAQGDGPLSGTSAAALTIPGAPVAPTAVAVSYQLVRVTWSPPSGPGAITAYHLFRSVNGGAFVQVPDPVASPYDDGNVSSTTSYAYAVVAVNATGQGPASQPSTVVVTPEGPPAAPAPPTGVASTTAIQIAVTWAPVGGATAYDVWRSTDGASFGASPVATGVTSPWTDVPANGVAANSAYFYAVQARNAYGSSPLSGPSAAALTIPDAPAPPTLSGVASNAITVTWSPPVGGTGAIIGYRLYRSEAGGAFAAVPGSPTSPWTDGTVQASTSYAYKVAALNATGQGFTSDASATVTTLPPLPGAPGAITFTLVKSYGVRVNWTAATSATSYKLERAPDQGGVAGDFAQVAVSSVTYNDNGSLTPSTTYWYRVRAVNGTGDGPYGTPAPVTTLATPYLYVGDGTDDPTVVSVCPTASPAPFVLDDFTLDAAVMADSVAKATVTLRPSGAWSNLAKLEITSADGSLVYGSAQPGADAVVVSITRTLSVAIGSGFHYKVRVTPKAALAMPAPRDGRSYDVGGTVTALESTNVKVYGDANSRTLRVDNASPPKPTWTAVTSGADAVSLSWTSPAAGDRVLVVRRVGGPVVDAPAEGAAPASGPLGSGTIVYEGTEPPQGGAPDGPLSAGTPYHYALFARDACNNWSPGAAAGPVFVTSGAVAEGDATPNSTRPVISIENPAKGTTVSGPFRVQVRVFTRTGTITNVQLNYASATGWLPEWMVLGRNTAYYDASSTTLGVFEPPARLSPGAGAYTLVARASNDGGATWVNSAAVPIAVNAAGQGDGNLLVRDNSNQLCSDCHAIRPHSSEASSAKHGSWTTTCRDCHAPHGSRNAYLVRNEITTPGITGAPVQRQVFFADATKGYAAVTPSTAPAQAGQAAFANQDLTGVCQACHTRTTGCATPPCADTDLAPMFRNSGPIVLETAHGAGTPCTACHTHTSGFKSPKQLCYNCHGVQARSEYPAAAPPQDTCGNTATQPGSTTNRVGAHAAHLAGKALTSGFGCEQCHQNPPTRSFHENNPPLCSDLSTERAFFTWGPITQGAAWSGPVTPSYDYVGQTCSNYCHGNFRNGNDARPSWNGDAPCGSCHGLPPSGTHVANPDCGNAACHGSGYSKTGAASGTVDRSRHANGVLDQYSTSCWSCHGQEGRTLFSGTVGAADPNVAAAPPMDTAGAQTGNYVGPHLGHVRPDPNQPEGQIHLPFRCSECHTAAVDTYTPSHPDPRPAEVSYEDAVYATQNGVLAFANPGSPVTCTTYCHGATFDPLTQRGSVATWAWNGTTVTCGSCHLAPPVDPEHTSVAPGSTIACNPCHDTTVGPDGKIIFSGSGASATTEHIDGHYDTGGISCQSCHGGVAGNPAPPKGLHGETATTALAVGAHQSHVQDGGVRNALACTQCHPNNTTMNHANGNTPETVFGTSLSSGTLWARSATPPTCSSSYCHGGQAAQAAWGGLSRTPQWTLVNGSFRACNACHNAPPPLNATTHHSPNPSCWKCHGAGYTTAGLSGEALNTHVDGSVTLVRALCTLCHGDLTATDVPASDPRAMPGYNANAADCTDATVATSAGVGAHAAHLLGTRLRTTASACADCHPLPQTDTDRTHATGGGPGGARATVSWSAFVSNGVSPSYDGSQTNAGVNVAGTCANTYCHGGKFNGPTYGAAYQGSMMTPSWTGGPGQAQCGACHKVWPTSPAHGSMTNTTSCAACHPGYDYTVQDGGTVNLALHINGKMDGGGGPNCLSVDCHGGSTIATRRNVANDYANGTGPAFRSHHVGNGATTITGVTATGMSATGMGGTLTNNDCYVCHAEAIQTAPGVYSTGALHRNDGVIDLRNVDTGAVYSYAKGTIPGASGTWNSSNPTWVTETSTHLDPFCNSCHDADGATGVSAFWETGATPGNPFNDGAVTNNYDRWIRCQTPPCSAPGFVVDIASRVDDDARKPDGTYWTPADRDVTGEERGPDGRNDPPYGVYSRHAIRGMSVSVYAGTNTTGSAWDGTGTPQVGVSTTYWNRTKVAWASNSVMSCADCHTHDGANGAAGNAHGSGSEYLLKDAYGGATEGAVKPTPTAGCFQCHSTGGYQAGSTHTLNGNDYQEYGTLTGVDRIASTWPAATGTGGSVYGHSCLNCHGGGMPSKIEAATRPGGFGTIHGTNQILGIGINGASGNRRAYRFTNGNSMRYYNPSATGSWTGGGSCFTISTARGTSADQWGGCNKHDGYPYTFPGGNRPLNY